jgi:hypothetical protein
LPDVLERPEPQLLRVVERRLVHPSHVLVAVRGDEGVVRLAALPAVDDEVAARRLEVAEELRADIPGAGAEELRPIALRAVDAFELGRVARLVREDERDQRRPPRS